MPESQIGSYQRVILSIFRALEVQVVRNSMILATSGNDQLHFELAPAFLLDLERGLLLDYGTQTISPLVLIAWSVPACFRPVRIDAHLVSPYRQNWDGVCM